MKFYHPTSCLVALITLSFGVLSQPTSAEAQSLRLPCRDRQICSVINIFLRSTEPLINSCPPTSNNPQDYANYLGLWFDSIPQIQSEINALNRSNSYSPPPVTTASQVATFLDTWVDIARMAQTYTHQIEQNFNRCSSSIPYRPNRSTMPSIEPNPEFPKACIFDPNTLTWRC